MWRSVPFRRMTWPVCRLPFWKATLSIKGWLPAYQLRASAEEIRKVILEELRDLFMGS